MPKRLSQNDIETLHLASCRILEEVGIIVRCEPAARILARGGATLRDGGVVTVPREFVSWAIGAAKPAFNLDDRRGGKIEIGKGRYQAVGGTMADVLDYPAWTQRPAATADLVELVRLCDALPLIDIVVPVVAPQDVESARQEVGVDVTINAGALNRAGAASPEQLIVDHEMLRYVDRIERGVDVNEETLALDVIRSVGPRGSYLDAEHTLRHLRSAENVYFEVFDRSPCRSL